jgi:uncharacterized protein YjiS (DUF1127 family)
MLGINEAANNESTDMATAAHMTVTASSVNAGWADVFVGIAAKIKQYRLYRQSVNELRSLSNAELADLGLSRSNIRYVARAAVYGE